MEPANPLRGEVLRAALRAINRHEAGLSHRRVLLPPPAVESAPEFDIDDGSVNHANCTHIQAEYIDYLEERYHETFAYLKQDKSLARRFRDWRSGRRPLTAEAADGFLCRVHLSLHDIPERYLLRRA